MLLVFLVLWVIYAAASKRWGIKATVDAIAHGVQDRPAIRMRVSRSVLLRMTIHFAIIGALFSFGAGTADRVPEVIGLIVFAWLVMLPIAIFSYGRGMRVALERHIQCGSCNKLVTTETRVCPHCHSATGSTFEIRCPSCGEIGSASLARKNLEVECPACKQVFRAAVGK